MPTSEQGADFIEFIQKAAKDERLAKEVLKKDKVEDLFAFFDRRGYTDISKDECKRILNAMNKLRDVTVHIPKKGEDPCPPEAGY